MGYGDALMATGEVRFLRNKNPNAKFIIGDGKRSYWSTIFDNNPYIIRGGEVKSIDQIIWVHNYENNRPYRLYDKKLNQNNYNWNKNYVALPGEIFFDENEQKFSSGILKEIQKKYYRKKIIFIEPHVKKRMGFENKDWGLNKWQGVVDSLKDSYVFLQTTYSDRKKLNNVVNIHGINFRLACSIMQKTDLFIGTEGGMHHAAAALNKKGVVIFGGHISPKITGYKIHKNLYFDDPRSPCGNKNKCDHCQEALSLISVKEMISNIKKFLD